MSPEVVTSIKVSRLQWAGTVQRMAEHEIPKKIMGNKFEGERCVGRIRLRWMDGVLKDLRKLKIKGWRLLPGIEKPGREFCGRLRLKLGCSATFDDTFSGIDQVPAELIQNGGNTLLTEIYNLLFAIWQSKCYQQSGRTPFIIPTYNTRRKLTVVIIIEEYHFVTDIL